MSGKAFTLAAQVLGLLVRACHAQPDLKGEPRLEIGLFTLYNKTTVTFKIDFVEKIGRTLGLATSLEGETKDRRFTVSCDLSKTSFNPVYYTFEAYLHDQREDVWRRYKVKVQPDFGFRDTLANLTFRVTGHGGGGVALVKGMPLYAIYDTSIATVVESDNKDNAQPVELFSSGSLKISAKNPSQQLPIRIVSIHLDPDHRAYWREYWHKPAPASQVEIAPAGSAPVEISVTPQTFPALAASIVHHDAKDGEDKIRISGTYQPLPGGPVRNFKVTEVPVTFAPPGQTLLFALLLGVLLGFVVVAMLMQPVFSVLLKSFGVAVVAAVVVELVGIGLVRGGSTLKVFGVSLDPVTAQGSFLIGIVVGAVCASKGDRLIELINSRLPFSATGGAVVHRGVILLLAILTLPAPVCSASLPFQPVGFVGAIKGEGLYVLSSDGKIFNFQREGDHIRVALNCKVPVGGQLLDLAPVSVKNMESLLTVQFVNSLITTRFYICAPGNSAGSLWLQLRGVFNGIVPDPVTSAIWVANSSTREIFRVADPKNPEYLTTVHDAASVTALAYDAGDRILYAGDPVNGEVYAVKIDTRKMVKIASGLGEIRSITVDKPNRRLLVVDSARQTLWSLPDIGKLAKATPFAHFSRRSEPCGVALQYQRVWVADCRNREVYAFTPQGQWHEPALLLP